MCTAAMCWGLGNTAAHLVVVAGTQYYDGSGLGASDYPITDLIQMIGRASRPMVGGGGGGRGSEGRETAERWVGRVKWEKEWADEQLRCNRRALIDVAP